MRRSLFAALILLFGILSPVGAASAGVESYTMDAVSRLSAVSYPDGSSELFGYDDSGYRVSQTNRDGVSVDGFGQVWDRVGGVETLVWDGSDGFLHAGGEVVQAGDDWLLGDAVGSARATTDSAGVVLGADAFDAFGGGSSAGVFGFVGEQADVTGLVHLRARPYDPSLGRFLSVDPVVPGAGGVVGYGHYGYAGQNPGLWSDPSGRMALSESRVTNRPAASFSASRASSIRGSSAGFEQIIANSYGAGEARRILLRELLRRNGPRVAVGLGGVFLTASAVLIGADSDSDELDQDPLRRSPNSDEALALSFSESVETVRWCRESEGPDSEACRGLSADLVWALWGDDAPTSALDDLARLCRSFSADTEVLMADGKTKPIAEIALGDEVWSIDPETGEAGAREVIAVWPHEDQLLEFMVEGGSVTTTEDHHFWNQTDHDWQETRDIDPGDHLLTADGQVVQAGELDWQTAHYATAYDLSVAETHSYFVAVGGDEVLVHNQGCEDYAREAQEIIGGDIYRIEAPGRLRLGSDHPLDVDGAWRHHEFVVKDGLVYDQHYNGIAYDLYMEQFPHLDALTLSKVD